LRQFSILFVRLDLLSVSSTQDLQSYTPLIAALIVATSQELPLIARIDRAARAFCVNLAASPREADRLGLELAQITDFEPPTEQLRSRVSKIISANIGPQALNFRNDGSISARFTRAVALYWLFTGPRAHGIQPQFPMNARSRSTYARIMRLNEMTAVRADTRYEDLIQAAIAFFTLARPSMQLENSLNKSIAEVATLVCSLIARFVLYCEVTRGGRLRRLSSMGFDATLPLPSFGRWAMTILLVFVLSAGTMIFMPGMRPIAAEQVLTIAITFALSISFAVWGDFGGTALS
jgi:hypothetical protein